MRIDGSPASFRPLPGAVPAFVATVDAAQWSALAEAFATAGFATGNALVALWGTDRRSSGEGLVVQAAYRTGDGLAVVRLPVLKEPFEYPDLSGRFPSAGRMQRAVFDLLGLRAVGADDARPWLRHGAWPEDAFPLREDFDARASFPVEQERYPFVTVEGDGVHEIPVGPIHAGIIEPGHFRCSIV